MSSLYHLPLFPGKRIHLALWRAAFLPPASWRVSSGVFYEEALGLLTRFMQKQSSVRRILSIVAKVMMLH
jgi:hypothetical protein